MKTRNYRDGTAPEVGDKILFTALVPDCALPREFLETRQFGVLVKFRETESACENGKTCLFKLDGGGTLALSPDDESVEFISRG